MKRSFAYVAVVLVLGLFPLAVPASAQTTPAAAKFSRPLSYDVSKEITLNGTVSSAPTTSSRGTMMGHHLLLQTSSGVVDASLGRFAFTGWGALSVEQGQHVAVTGVMKNFSGKPVLLARSVTVNGRVYTIRNERGLPLSPHARQRISQGTVRKGGLL